ncbi:MAG: hypothetical protein KKH94_11250 [Candidatus Omnitrophica bacterium]|nr:hypothetical protein [Candidatus Omnitrophota bacterium]
MDDFKKSVRNIDLVTMDETVPYQTTIPNTLSAHQRQQQEALVALIADIYKQKVETALRGKLEQEYQLDYQQKLETARKENNQTVPLGAAFKKKRQTLRTVDYDDSMMLDTIEAKIQNLVTMQNTFDEGLREVQVSLTEFRERIKNLDKEKKSLTLLLRESRRENERGEKRIAELEQENNDHRIKQQIVELEEYISALDKGQEVLARPLQVKVKEILSKQNTTPSYADKTSKEEYDRIKSVLHNLEDIKRDFTEKKSNLQQLLKEETVERHTTDLLKEELEYEKKRLLEMLGHAQ